MKFINKNCGMEMSTHKSTQIGCVRGLGYLELWFDALKMSPEYKRMCDSGLIEKQAAFKTYKLFGSIHNLDFEQWWNLRGSNKLSNGVIEIGKGVELAFDFNLEGSQLAVCIQGVEHLSVDQLIAACQIAKKNGSCLLSDNPLIWPFFYSRISTGSISNSLRVVKAIQAMLGANGKLWQVGQQLNLKPDAMPRPTDMKIEILDKRSSMTKLVNSLKKKGIAIANNASSGIFPSFDRA